MLNPRTILRHSSKISAANFLGIALSLPTSIIVTRELGPELYGLAGIILLWPFYADLFRPGLMATVMREVAPLLERRELERAQRIQNVAVTGELAYGVVAILVLLAGSVLVDNPTVAVGVRLAAVVFAITHVYQILLALQWTHREFRSLSRLSLYHRSLSSIAILALLWWIGPYSLVVAPAIAALVAIGLMLRFAPPRGLRLTADVSELKRLLSVGVALMFFSFFLQGFKVVDRTAIAVWMSPTDLGLFAFALNFVNVPTVAFTDFGSVMQPMIWGKLGEHGSMRDVGDTVQQVAVMLGVVSFASATIGQAAFGAFVHALVPNFGESVRIFEWLVFLLPLYAATILPNTLLVSKLLNKHTTNAVIWGVGLLLKGVGVFVLVRVLQLGLTWVAIGVVVAQLIVAIGLHVSVHRDLMIRSNQALRYYGWLLGTALVGLTTAAILRFDALAFDSNRPWESLGIRLLVALIVWTGVGFIAKRTWLTSPRFPESLPESLGESAVSLAAPDDR